jgi:hypothetical protein
MKKYLLIAALLATPAHAEYMVYGIGVTPCALLNAGKITELQLGAWIGGYVSGVNEMASRALNQARIDATASTDIDILVGFVKSGCWHNPQQTIQMSASGMVSDFIQGQASRPSQRPGVRYQ